MPSQLLRIIYSSNTEGSGNNRVCRRYFGDNRSKELHQTDPICSTVALKIKRWLTTAKLQPIGQKPEAKALLISSRRCEN